jgi:hypothetical protein
MQYCATGGALVVDDEEVKFVPPQVIILLIVLSSFSSLYSHAFPQIPHQRPESVRSTNTTQSFKASLKQVIGVL